MDCKALLRKYVLVSRPSKWARSDRVVVQSPVHNITDESVIPVRRFNGDDENLVCFMPVQDIEKDGSIAYKNAMITSTATLIDAHGVALFESSSEDFDYHPGDKFWLFITANRDGYTHDAPVINLRTMKAGSVPILHVCWFPKMHGPGNEVWTFGGSTRRLKHPGKNLYTFWAWGICQYLDGKPAIAKDTQIPEKDNSTDEQQWLLPDASRSLFSQIYKNMIKVNHFIMSPLSSPQSSPAQIKSSKMPYRSLYTPSTSPCSDNLEEGSSHSPNLIFKRLDGAVWESILNFASKGTPKPPKSSLIHPQRILSSSDRRKYRRTEVDVDTRSNYPSTNKSVKPPARLPSLTMGNDGFRPYSNDLGALILDQDGEGIPVLSAAHPRLRTNPMIISERYQTRNNTPTVEFSHIQTELYLKIHYHPDHRKCTSAKYIPGHEHCVSAERALPSFAGPCLLSEGAREHECCLWKVEDTEDWPVDIKKEFDTRKIEEARKYLMAGYDMSFQFTDQIKDESKKIKEEIWFPTVDDDVFDGPGKWLNDEISKREYIDELSQLLNMEDDNQDQDQLHSKDFVNPICYGC
ncbi:hypothetical protein EYC80_001190 [Monilinia laxa]|uniref:Uncharacterized protein n=1 Tax=Monilinia laxa TaxID=61186 RepID=A0A5N6K8H3_MONLA|nr:hypothetical protein EYC80_001190 [Monilinia laxa]